MLKNYFTIAVNNLLKNKLYSAINIIGLAIGMACTIMIMLWIQDELSYDKFHENADNLYRVIEYQTYSDRRMQVEVTPHPLAAALKNDYPEVIESTRFNKLKFKNIAYNEKRFKGSDGAVADPSLFKMFTFPFLKGDPGTALSEPNSIVISGNFADRYFGTEEALGKVLNVNNKYGLKVTGIFKNVPNNSHIHFDYVISFDTLSGMRDRAVPYNNWGNNSIYTYILLRENTDAGPFGKKIEGYIKTKFSESTADIYLQALTDIHLHSGSKSKYDGYGSIYNVYMFFVISVFILLISCINYICLTTARYSMRAKEVGIRKVSGAKRPQLIVQFLCESLFITLIALILSLGLLEMFLPVFNSLSGKELNIGYFNNLPFVGIILGVAVFTGVFSGFYPAFVLSLFKPGDVLKGKFSTNRKDILFRKGMVLMQWCLSIILIIGTWIAYSQFMYLNNKNLGFDREQIVYLNMDEDLKQKYDSIKKEFLNDPGVMFVTSCMDLPNNLGNSTYDIDWEGKTDNSTFLFYNSSIDFDFIETFNLEIVEGRSFSLQYSSDSFSGSSPNFIVNETAVKIMGLTDPVGKWFSIFGIKGKIVGVLKDFHHNDLNYRIGPTILSIVPDINDTLVVKVSPDNMLETISSLKKKLNLFVPDNIYEFRFYNEDFNSLYNPEKIVSKILRSFTFLGIFLASLGLIALVGFMIEKRTREIGIRKTLGASAARITLLMSAGYMKMVVMANIIAWPVAWFFLTNWLENYAYRINMRWTPFIGAGLLVLVISQLIVCCHSIKAARTRPVKSLRYE
ncbi:MAG: ABC transporter permease [Desulfobacteraceae bacterium]|jgi:ABC-type antimicrobial peptide transport system permease subunit